jgi:hypothetical protein
MCSYQRVAMRSYSLSGYVQLFANGYVQLLACRGPSAGDRDPYLLDLMDRVNVFSRHAFPGRNAIRTNVHRKRGHTSQ